MFLVLVLSSPFLWNWNENFQSNLEKKYATKFKVIKMDIKGKVTTYLVIDSETDTESVCKFACELGNADAITDTGFCKETECAVATSIVHWHCSLLDIYLGQ
jgi:hypothetical protein